MKRSLIITGAVAVFAASTALSIVVADSMQDESRTVLPAATADGGAAVLTDSLITDEEVVANDDLPAPSVDAGYVSLLPSSDTPADDEPAVGDAYPWPTDGDSGDTTGDPADTGDGSGGGVDAERLGAELLGSPTASDAYSSRFVDLCAENPDSTLCPTGVGGTVLVPFGGESSYGVFDVFTMYSTPTPFWDCKVPSELEPDEYPVLVNANHPALIEIEYHPVDDPTDSQTEVVDLDEPTVVSEFTTYVAEHGTVPAEGVHHCFVLQSTSGHRSYQVTAQATSFTGETDTLVQRVDLNPRRPAVIITPLQADPLQAIIGVPVANDPEEYAVVRMLRVADGQSCADIEDSMMSGDSDAAVPAPGYGWHEDRISWAGSFIPAPGDWAEDVYDLDAWYVQLEESTDYRMCVWWLRSPRRSFDPLYMSVTERESRLISTPDTMRTRIYVDGTHAGNDALDAGAVSVEVRSGCNQRAFVPAEFRVPTVPVAANHSQFFLDGGHVLCEYPGISQPATTEVVITGPGMEPKFFELPTPLTTEPSSEMYFLYFGPSTCLSGVSFGEATGDCDSRQPDHPDVVLSVVNVAGASNGLTDWLITEGQEFDAPDRAPEALPVDIRLDVFSSHVETIDRNSLRVVAHFDRPVTLSASLEGDPCLLGAAPSYSSSTRSVRHTFVLDGLCTLTTYGVRLEANDGTTTTVFSGSADQWYGFGRTDGYHVSYTVTVGERPYGWNERLYASWWVHFDVNALDAWGAPTLLRGEPVPVGAPSRCLEPRLSAPQEAVWGDTVQLTVQARLQSAVLNDRGYCIRRTEGGYSDYGAEVISTIPIEDLQAGPVTVTVPFSSHSGFSIDLVIIATVSG